jgi:hypothetical protein
MRSGRAIGLQVAIYNPDIDTDGSNGRGLAATVREALSTPPVRKNKPTTRPGLRHITPGSTNRSSARPTSGLEGTRDSTQNT